MQTLTYGYKKPETGDRGNVFFPALEDNIDRVNDHDHNGTNSAKLTTTSTDATRQTIAAGSWVDQGNDVYRQTITMPSGLEFDNVKITFHLNTAPYEGVVSALSVVKASVNTYTVDINIDNLEVIAVYTS
jgi:hypothetical protein